MNKALFLDRDGTINEDTGYVHKISDFHFMDGVIDFCRLAQSKGFKIIVITNQSGIARGYFTESDYQKLKLLAGDVFAGLYYKSKESFHPGTEKEKSRVREVDKMARDICLDSFRHWSVPRRVKLLAPRLYLFLSHARRKTVQSQN